jgi:ABC-type siderophore export system fused ATPase/permease subunit
MLSPEVGRAAFTWAILIVIGAVGLLAVLSPGTPEFAITVVTLLVGLVFLGLVVALIHLAAR